MDELQQQQQQQQLTGVSSRNSNNNLIGPNSNHKHLATALPDHSVALNNQQQHLCAGCQMPIRDRYLLQALDAYWHEDCLKCSCCGCRLGEVGSNLFAKANLILCKRDYLRLFGATGNCSACSKPIPAFEMVMRAKTNVYHLDCFACQQCHQRFCVGDRFYLSDNQILCEYDYEERNLNTTTTQQPNNNAIIDSSSPYLVVFNHRATDYANKASERFGDEFAESKAPQGEHGPLNCSPNSNNGQQQHHHHEHDASSSGYGSPDSAGGIIDEG